MHPPFTKAHKQIEHSYGSKCYASVFYNPEHSAADLNTLRGLLPRIVSSPPLAKQLNKHVAYTSFVYLAYTGRFCFGFRCTFRKASNTNSVLVSLFNVVYSCSADVVVKSR